MDKDLFLNYNPLFRKIIKFRQNKMKIDDERKGNMKQANKR